MVLGALRERSPEQKCLWAPNSLRRVRSGSGRPLSPGGTSPGWGQFQEGCRRRGRPSLLASFLGRKPARVSSEAKRCVAGKRVGVSWFQWISGCGQEEGGCSMSPGLALAPAQRLPDGRPGEGQRPSQDPPGLLKSGVSGEGPVKKWEELGTSDSCCAGCGWHSTLGGAYRAGRRDKEGEMRGEDTFPGTVPGGVSSTQAPKLFPGRFEDGVGSGARGQML